MTDPMSNRSMDCLNPKKENGDAREHFIPIRQADLVKRLAAKLNEGQCDAFIDLTRLLAATFHYEFHQRLDKLKEAYATLDPDRDTRVVNDISIAPGSPTPDAPAAETFFEKILELLERANFSRLDRADIEHAVEAVSDWGVNLQIDFARFQRLEVFARGDIKRTRTRRRLRNFYRVERIDVPMFQRLVVVFQLRADCALDRFAEPNRVYLKLFKNIPKMDLDMLLPGTRVRISRLDQGKIVLPTLSGIVMALVKIIKGVALLATATGAGLLSFLGILGGTIGYGIKSFLGYLRTKEKYQLNLTRNLYFQNLDNNSGVLFRILDEAEEQEVREALIAWFLLWQQAPNEGWTQAELDRAAETFLQQEFSIDVDFEIDDAMAKLTRLGLSSCHQGRWTAVSLTDALERLDCAWDNFFQYNQIDARRAG